MENFVKYRGKIRLLSPLSHNADETLGTDTKFRRINSVWNGSSIRIPVYSGNAFRGILRRIAAKQFCDLLGLKKETISDRLYYTWFTGGMLQKGSSQDYIEVGQKREVRETIPFLSIFGCALQNQILGGKMDIGMAIPIAKETEHMTGIESTMTIWEMVDEIFYTRRDDLEDPKEQKEQAQQMKYSGEVLVPGTELSHNIALSQVSDIEISCFHHAMSEMVSIGVLGGKSSVGHGQVKFDYGEAFDKSQAYLDYVAANKQKMLDYVAKMGICG